MATPPLPIPPNRPRDALAAAGIDPGAHPRSLFPAPQALPGVAFSKRWVKTFPMILCAGWLIRSALQGSSSFRPLTSGHFASPLAATIKGYFLMPGTAKGVPFFSFFSIPRPYGFPPGTLPPRKRGYSLRRASTASLRDAILAGIWPPRTVSRVLTATRITA